MNLVEYKVTYCPFPQSDTTATTTEYAETPEKAKAQFEMRNPLWRVKEISL